MRCLSYYVECPPQCRCFQKPVNNIARGNQTNIVMKLASEGGGGSARTRIIWLIEHVCTKGGGQNKRRVRPEIVKVRVGERRKEGTQTTNVIDSRISIDDVNMHRMPPCLECRSGRRAHVIRVEPVELNPGGDQRV